MITDLYIYQNTFGFPQVYTEKREGLCLTCHAPYYNLGNGIICLDCQSKPQNDVDETDEDI